ncbi:hypothetical protein [Aeromicrobium sp. CTD01-1L150]|uniref:hypothetical protein n=1 Tax=Aeromicrobium sp. CTD01-1L150 TaxID=3341830 RepID=UPI0035C036AE
MTSAVERLRRSGRRSPVVVVLGFLLAVALVAIVVLVWRLAASTGPGDAETEALSVARERAEQLTTYDHGTFEEDVAWAEQGATSDFAAEYAEANEPVQAVVERLEATAEGSVIEASAMSADDGSVEVLLFVDQTITQAADGEQRTERNRVVMSMVHEDGQWLVDDVTLR